MKMENKLYTILSDPQNLADIRATWMPDGSCDYGAIMTIAALIDYIAKLKGWKLETYKPDELNGLAEQLVRLTAERLNKNDA